jgi:hypothetical protein
MSQNFDNRRRAFADVVTIDAWHDAFDGEKARADLHADIVFGIARVGGEAESPVRFRLSIKRAEIVLVIPPTEPVKIDPSSVSRDSPDLPARVTEVVEHNSHAKAGVTAGLSISRTGVDGTLAGEAGAQTTVSTSKKLEATGTVEFMVVTQSKTADGHYRWTVQPRQSRVLQGRPWDATSKARATLVDKRRDKSKGIPPIVRVEVRCRREDLVIEDLTVKDEKLWHSIKARAGFSNRLTAAESYIRDRLEEEGFEAKNIAEMFTELTLAAVTAESSSEH